MNDARNHPARRTSPGEWVASAVLLLALPAVAVAILLARGEPPPGPAPPQGASGGAAAMPDLIALLPTPEPPSPFEVAVVPEQWPAEKMHEKIDGEDKAYLKHGCVGLAAATLKHRDSGVTIEMFLYRMADPAGAEAVFNEQAPSPEAPDPRDRPEWVAIGDRAYLSYGCCYLRDGAHYLKLLAAAETPAAAGEVRRLARRFVRQLPSRRHVEPGTE